METLLLVLIVSSMNIWCFISGAKVGQKVVKGEEVQLPNVNPLEAYREHQAKKEAQMEQDRLDIIMQNIEGYDGTGANQEDVPGR